MYRHTALGALGAALVTLAALGTPATGQPKQPGKGHPMHGPMAHCAMACGKCAFECESCFHHCAHLVAEGKKDHAHTMHLCNDCGDICAVTAKLCARHGPLAVTACHSCAHACDHCGVACAKHGDDEHMKRCARACHECAQACREMIKHAAQHHQEHKAAAKEEHKGKQ